jgi:large conductance mechanosensitive channel
MWKDFKKFILRGNTIDVAVAFVIGAAFNGVIQSLVKDLITPLVAAIGGNPNFSNYYFTLHHSRFDYGDFLNSLISFLLIATAIFFLVIQPINKLIAYASKLKTPPDPTDKKCVECLSTIPIAATRCAFCGIKQPAKKTAAG